MGDRPPTSHEQRAGEPWDASFQAEPAPWDIGEPQPAFARLAQDGAFTGAVLDAGCGTGEHALLAAALGLRVLGVDVAETALSLAREKAALRGLQVEFALADALRLDRLGRTFDTVLDCGLFHTFDDRERRAYVGSLASVTRAGAALHLLCFSDAATDLPGPYPVREAELRDVFASGWRVAALAPDRLTTRFAPQGVPAWLARIERT
jgi:SAM-dependent methyltransferase